MSNKLITTNNGGLPFNWDDLRWALGQSASDAGIYQALESILKAFGSDFIISGCEIVAGPVMQSGWIFFNNEILKVDSQSVSGAYFAKSTTYDSAGDKTTRSGSSVQMYQKNRATMTSSTTTLSITGDRLEDKLNGLIVDASTSSKGRIEIATSAEAMDFSSSSLAITPSTLGDVTGGLSTRIINIGNWNMYVGGSGVDNVTVSDTSFLSSFSATIRSINVMILNDSGIIYDFNASTGGGGSYVYATPSSYFLKFNSSSSIFNSGAFQTTPRNRGYITVRYVS